MNPKFDIKKEEQKPEKKSLPATLLNGYEKNLYSKISVLNEETPEEWKSYFINNLSTDSNPFRAEFSEQLKNLNIDSIKSKHEFAKLLAQELFNFYNKNLTPAELEEISRKGYLSDGKKQINRFMYYEVEESNVLQLHVPVVVEENPRQLLALFKDGLSKLAEQLVSNPEMANVKEIFGKSWLVFYQKNFFERSGFTVDPKTVDEKTKEATMKISREKLIEMYGNK